MTDRFKWLGWKTEYREARASKHGEELRWIVNRETILNAATGQSITRSVIRHPGICVIAALPDDDHVVLMHQYRYSVDGLLWELPAGTLDGREENGRMESTETPQECAARELLEETGYQAGRIDKIYECYAMPGSSDEIIHIFLALDLTKREQSLDIGEVIDEVRAFSFSEIERMIAGGEIRDAKTLVGLFLLLSRRRDGA